ncbi:MAG: 4-hydroxybutyrate--acetyl-CoA CoA transferase [Clostridia bacterium]|nr:4-hydroxybutyrate--acetyl-CoA CoA transferase [Clostridia bacterium]
MSDFEKLYQEKLMTADELVRSIPAGTTMFTEVCLSEPKGISEAFRRAIAEDATNEDITIHSVLDMYPTAWYEEAAAKSGKVRGVSWFSGPFGRKGVNKGWIDLMPTAYVDMINILKDNPQIDTLCIAVAPMDEDGYFSTGVCCSCIPEFLKQCKHIYLEVNDKMPVSLSSKPIHISQVTALCECNYSLPEAPKVSIDPITKRMGEIVAAEVPDGATLQLGIGAIPDAVGMALKDHKHLGVHTELITDTLIELVLCGAADNSLKPENTGKTVATIAFGTQKKLYDYIDNNPDMLMLPVYYVNDPMVMARHPNFISVNSALEVDLYGQVCAESIGPRHHSGAGGQVEYCRGAVMSPGGKSFITLTSTITLPNGEVVSRIKPFLTYGAQVTTGKNDVDYVVTEYGAAKLRHKTLSQRTRALIDIAHPDFREELEREARNMNILI